MSKEKYQALLAKYLNGECTDEERALLDQWYEALDAEKDSVEILDPVKKAAFLEKNWEALQAKTPLEVLPHKSSNLWWRWFAAASILILISVSFFWFKNPDIFNSAAFASQRSVEHRNTTPKAQLVKLPDGSKITLAKNASILLDKHFGRHTREVRLEGEAFFEVARNPKVPFLVRSKNLVTEVLGTSFLIQPRKDQKTIEVSVKTGRVSVYAEAIQKTQKLNGVILTPNQKVTFNTTSRTIEQGIVDRPKVVIPNLPKSNFQFDETSLEKVANALQNAYGVEIVILNPGIRQCAFTGDLNGLGLQEQLRFVCGTINAEFEIRGSSVFILGRSCN